MKRKFELKYFIVAVFMLIGVDGECDRCQHNNPIACHGEDIYSRCVNGKPTYDNITCPHGFVCTGDVFLCLPREAVTPICGRKAIIRATPNECGVCASSGKVFACLNKTTIAFCFGHDQPYYESLSYCPEGTVCDLNSGSKFCTDERLIEPSCARDEWFIPTTPAPKVTSTTPMATTTIVLLTTPTEVLSSSVETTTPELSADEPLTAETPIVESTTTTILIESATSEQTMAAELTETSEQTTTTSSTVPTIETLATTTEDMFTTVAAEPTASEETTTSQLTTTLTTIETNTLDDETTTSTIPLTAPTVPTTTTTLEPKTTQTTVPTTLLTTSSPTTASPTTIAQNLTPLQICEQNGIDTITTFFALPGDATCKRYIMCTKLGANWTVKEMTCSTNKWFDPVLEKCSESYRCFSTNSAVVTATKPTTPTTSILTTSTPVTSTLITSTTTTSKTTTESKTTTPQSTTTTKHILTPLQVCEENGIARQTTFFALPGDVTCKKYIMCNKPGSSWTVKEMTCSSNKTFDPVLSKCSSDYSCST